jgi:serine/threonine-protein kinase
VASALRPFSLAGLQVGAYTLIAPLGGGGTGSVWLARRSDGRFEAKVAIKLLNAALVGQPAERRFMREGSLLAKLIHPHIARLIDAGIAPGGQPYLALEHVEGEPIDKYCEQHCLDTRAQVRLFLDVLAAVEQAHSQLIVHRDLKPSNILVTNTGVVKLLDFGVASLVAPNTEASEEFTRECPAGLTPEYAAPEQLLGSPVTTATDVYALGLVLLVLLAGRHPVAAKGKSAAEVIRMTLETDAPRASTVAIDLSRGRALRGDLDNIIGKALKKDPTQRYLTAGALAQDLRRYLAHEPVSARPDTFAYRVGKLVRRHGAGLATALVTAIALIATATFALVQMNQARAQRNEAVELSKIAEGYSSVILSLLSQVGPGGRALYPSELLERAVIEVEKRYADDPAVQVSMLMRISGRYYDLRDTNNEYKMLLKAERIARQARDPLMVLHVQCGTVETDLNAGRKAEALRRLQEVREILRTTPQVSAGLAADCWRAEAEFSAAHADWPAALAQWQRARQALEDGDRTWGNRYSGVLSGLARNSFAQGDVVQAHRYYLELAAVLRRYGRIESMAGLLARSALADSLYAMGQVQSGLEQTERILQGWNTLQNAAPLNPTVATRYGEMLSRVGRHDEALSLLRRAIADCEANGNKVLATTARLNLARALLRAHEADQAQAVLEDAYAVLRAESERSPLAIEALRMRADIYLAQGRMDEAAAALQSAWSALNAANLGLKVTRARMSATQAQVELSRRQFDAARDSADEAAVIFRYNSIAPDESADVAEALLMRARAEAGSGDREAARKTEARANEILRRALASGE